MVEDDRHRSDGNQIGHGFDHRQSRINLHVPVGAILDAVDGGLKALTRHGGIHLAEGLEVDPYAANAGAIHVIERGVGSVAVNNSDGASFGSELPGGIEGAGIVGAVDAGMDDHDALNVQSAVQRAGLIDRCVFRGVDARGRVREAVRISEDVRVAVARAHRHVEVHQCSGL